jgi:glutathione S-transferase
MASRTAVRRGLSLRERRAVKLYVLPGACSLAAHIALEAAPGAVFETIVLERGHNRQQPYLTINPLGTVPALIDERGNVIVESIAILLHIADRYPESGLVPPLGDPARDRLHSLLAYMVSTAHPAFQMLWRTERFALDSHAHAAVAEAGELRLAGVFDVLEKELNGRDHLVGRRFTVADAYLFVVGRWGLRLRRPTYSYPNLWRFTRDAAMLPPVQRAMAREGITLTEPCDGIG